MAPRNRCRNDPSRVLFSRNRCGGRLTHGTAWHGHGIHGGCETIAVYNSKRQQGKLSRSSSIHAATWFTMSTAECTASASMDALPEKDQAVHLATNMAELT